MYQITGIGLIDKQDLQQVNYALKTLTERLYTEASLAHDLLSIDMGELAREHHENINSITSDIMHLATLR